MMRLCGFGRLVLAVERWEDEAAVDILWWEGEAQRSSDEMGRR